jgi:hypothetical protein
MPLTTNKQNMMHSNMDITDGLYGKLALDNVREVILGLEADGDKNETAEMYDLFQDFMRWKDQRK